MNTCHSYVFKFSNRQLAEAMVHEASNMQRRLKNEPTIPLPKSASSVEPRKVLSNGQVKEQQKTAAAILADQIAASSNAQQILQSALSKFAAEEFIWNPLR